jgi:hypothetical protein
MSMGVGLARPLWRIARSLRGARAILAGSSILLAVFVIAGSVFDQTLWSRPRFVGLSSHKGYYAMFLLTPVIIGLTGWLIDEFTRVIENTSEYCLEDRLPEVVKLVRQHLRYLEFRPMHWSMPLIMFVFFVFWALNCYETSTDNMARQNLGNLVFDSGPYRYGYIFGKAYLLFIMVGVYSWVLFVACWITYSMDAIFKSLHNNNALRIDLFNVDHCGGLSRFGNINLTILGIYSLFSVITLTTAFTHTRLYLLMFVLFPLYLVAGVGQTVFGVRFIARSVARAKRERLEVATSTLRSDFALWTSGGRFSSDLLVLRNYIITIRNYPYAAHLRLYLLNAVSPIAGIAGLLKIFIR